jgi:hypothetical protein
MILTGKDAEKFEAQDKKPLSKKQKAHLERCRATYKNTLRNKTMRKKE